MNLIEISNKIPTEKDAVIFFEIKRWGKKTKCAYCESINLHTRTDDHRNKCRDCGSSSSVTVGTKLQGTKIPLKTWLYAFAIISDAKKGLSALQLQRNLGISYPTAWAMYHKIREFMIVENKGIDELENIVEMDETFIGGKPRKGADTKSLTQKKKVEYDERIEELKKEGYEFKGGSRKVAFTTEAKRGRGTSKIPLVGIVERDGNVVVEVMRNLTYQNLKTMVEKHVSENEAVLITDEYSGYNRIDRIIEHVKVDHQKMYSYRGINTNSIESFGQLLKDKL
jgi:transposase-like protein